MNKPIVLRRKHLVIMYTSMFMMFVLAIVFALVAINHAIDAQQAAQLAAQHQAMKPVCDLLSAFKEGYEQQPPSTAAGQRQYEAIITIYNQFGCSGTGQ